MQYCLSAKLTTAAKSLALARVYCNFVVVPHEIPVRESLYTTFSGTTKPCKRFSGKFFVVARYLIATHATLSHRLRRCQLPFREHIKVRSNSQSKTLQYHYIFPEREGGCELQRANGRVAIFNCDTRTKRPLLRNINLRRKDLKLSSQH